MPYSSRRYSEIPYSSVGDRDFSELSLFFNLLLNQDEPRAYLLDLKPYAPSTCWTLVGDSGIWELLDNEGCWETAEGEVEWGASLGLDQPLLNNRYWAPVLEIAVDSVVELPNSMDFGGAGRSTFGNISLLIGGTYQDVLASFVYDGRPVTVFMGGKTFAFQDFNKIFVGTAEDITYDKQRLSIILRDKSEFLKVPLQDTLYLGTGSLEGGEDLTGVRKPTSWGSPKNITPVLIDRVNLIYQYHDGPTNAVEFVYDGANEVTFEGDVADITATTVSAGSYKTQLTGGYIKLGAEPTKILTADVQGELNDSGVFLQTTADIVNRIISTRTQLTLNDIDQQSVANVNLVSPGGISMYNPQGTVLTAIADLLAGIGGNFTISRTGLLTLGIIKISTPVGTIDVKDILETPKFSKIKTPIPSWRRKLGFNRSWTVQGQNDIVPAADSARKTFVSHEFRFVVSEDEDIKARNILAKTIERETFFDTASDATTEADRLQELFGEQRSMFTFTAKRQQLLYRVGQTITVNFPRFGFPRDMVIISLGESTLTKRTTFKVWG